MEVTDRIASLEQRVQMQEDDIQLLKSALADVVRRLNITEEQQAVLNRKGPTKGGHRRHPGAAGGWASRTLAWPVHCTPMLTEAKLRETVQQPGQNRHMEQGSVLGLMLAVCGPEGYSCRWSVHA